jgi:hypothetical protein
MRLSIVRAEVAVQAAQFGSWNRNWLPTNRFIDRGATGVGVGLGVGVGAGVGTGVGEGVGVAAGVAVGVGLAVAAGVGVGVGVGVARGVGVGVVAEEAPGDGSAAAAIRGATTSNPTPRRNATAIRCRIASPNVIDRVGDRMVRLTVRAWPARVHGSIVRAAVRPRVRSSPSMDAAQWRV